MAEPEPEVSDADLLRNLRRGVGATRDDPDVLEAAVRRVLFETAAAASPPADAAAATILRNLKDHTVDEETRHSDQQIRRALMEGAPRRLRQRTPPPAVRRPAPVALSPVVPRSEPTAMELALIEASTADEGAGWVMRLSELAKAWELAGFTPAQVRQWRTVGVAGPEPGIAEALRDYGFTPASASAMVYISPQIRTAISAVREGESLEHVVRAFQDRGPL